MTDSVPTASALSAVYSDHSLPAASERYLALVEAFRKRFEVAPDFVARSPGRVNIIGEHIDYCGFSVLPMAVDRDVLIAVSATPNTSSEPSVVTLTNIESKYPEAVFSHSLDNPNVIDIDSSVHAWSNYFKCGYKGVHEDLRLTTAAPNLRVMVSGNVPAGAGLSSSSAFVCATAVAIARACGASLVKQRLTETAIRGERYAGVQCGGMDQSISIMASPSSALLIDFYPKLAASPVLIPPSTRPYKFVVANSLVTADKHVTAARNYNLRVVETRIVASIIGAAVRDQKGEGFVGLETLRSVCDAVDPNLQAALTSLEKVNAEVFGDNAYSREDTLAALQKYYGADRFPTWDSVAEVFCQGVGSVYLDAGLELKKRGRHVLSEARRVLEFTDVCALRAPGYRGGDVLTELGDLMNASQASCASDFNCSCAELDELTALCRASGAVGSRLTGAGWGGCTVSLVPEELVESFIEKVIAGYYEKRQSDLSNVKDWIFATTPGVGAVVLEI
ncbi:galactokinase [Entophlyctis luteolus]|nr:galactokinase [Entophlyctis luteolus]